MQSLLLLYDVGPVLNDATVQVFIVRSQGPSNQVHL
jgi:hypothetical protein